MSITNTHPAPTGVEADVCNDISARQRFGIAKYGTTVAENPLPLRAWLQHAYEECLDQAVYLRRAIHEIDAAAAREPNAEAQTPAGASGRTHTPGASNV